jgi:CPA2 family monovalent cation:H+ antiporter-2
VILPLRETFAAVFFVSLGTLIRLETLLAMPLICLAALAAVLVLKTSAATIALHFARLPWKSALGMGLGLAQIGEFAFVLLVTGLSQGIIEPESYDLMMFIAVASLILTPQLLKIGLRLAERSSVVEREIAIPPASKDDPIRRATVVGIGPVGSRIASQLETMGYDVCLVDLNPLNLHPFSQQGFRTVAGHGSDRSVLRRADVPNCGIVAITMPADRAAIQTVSAVRRLNTTATILVRCRFQASASKLRSVGATNVFSDESEVAGRFMEYVEQFCSNP